MLCNPVQSGIKVSAVDLSDAKKAKNSYEKFLNLRRFSNFKLRTQISETQKQTISNFVSAKGEKYAS